MRRTPIVLTATVLGTAGVLLFKPLNTSTVASASAADDGASSSGSSSSSDPGSTPSSSTSSSSSSSSAKDGTYTGTAETTRFGTTQVAVTISGGKITEVRTVQLNSAEPRSVQISESAAPMLRSEVLSKQTAAVDTISGATYTTVQYEASLQSALDKAGYAASDGSKASTDLSTLQESGGFGH